MIGLALRLTVSGGREAMVRLILIAIAVVSAGAGFLASALFLHAQLGYALVAPQPAYYGITLAGMAVSLAIVATTFPLLTRMTGPEVARNE